MLTTLLIMIFHANFKEPVSNKGGYVYFKPKNEIFERNSKKVSVEGGEKINLKNRTF